jgi:hypothetical protein
MMELGFPSGKAEMCCKTGLFVVEKFLEMEGRVVPIFGAISGTMWSGRGDRP